LANFRHSVLANQLCFLIAQHLYTMLSLVLDM
jgi:hypothetical protein